MPTIIAELALIGRILAEWELLEIRIGLRQQTNDKHTRSRGVQCGHGLWGTWLRVSRWIDDYYRQWHNVHPHGLKLELG